MADDGFTRTLQVPVMPHWPELIERAADRHGMTPAGYMRMALAMRLEADGHEVGAPISDPVERDRVEGIRAALKGTPLVFGRA